MRPLRWLLALIGGYFWLPCPRCGRMFAGFEIRGRMPHPTEPNMGLGTCCQPYVYAEAYFWPDGKPGSTVSEVQEPE